jgi:hypothetical protein
MRPNPREFSRSRGSAFNTDTGGDYRGSNHAINLLFGLTVSKIAS